MKNFWRGLWRLPLLVGAGALFTYGARATAPDDSGHKANSSDAARHRGGEVLLKIENDNIYFSQDAGRTFQELELAATPETKRLKRLVGQSAASSRDASGDSEVKVRPTLVADGAGGLQWARPKPTRTTDNFNGAQQATAPARSASTDTAHPPARPMGTAKQTKPE